MAEEAHGGETVKTEMKEAAHDIESKIKGAMSSRVGHFKEQSDSLTLEGVRRLLEKDLGLETYALDVHKRFIKQCLSECINGAGDENVTKNSGEDVEKNVCSTRGEATESPDGLQSKRDEKEPSSEDEEKAEDSPVLGLLTGHKTTKFETEETQGNENKVVLSESMIKKAIRRRASYFKANSEKVTMAVVRRLLEEDLKLDKNTLDPYKKFISEQVEEVLESLEVSKAATGVKKKSLKKSSQSKASQKISSEGSSDSLDSESEEAEEDEVKPKKRNAPKGKTQNSEGLKKRKRPAKETKEASKKRIKPEDTISEDNSGAEDDGNVSENSHSQSSAEKSVKKKEVSTPAYGKRVENLKSVIKSCGMSVPPSVYKKVKQAPENKREAHLIKELAEILSREGLSTNPSEKEIKDVRKRKERAKELEGIDMSNIVSSSRRRSTGFGFVAPPKPKIPVESDGDDAEDTDNDDDTDDENDDDDNDNNGDDDSHSDDLDEDNDEDSD